MSSVTHQSPLNSVVVQQYPEHVSQRQHKQRYKSNKHVSTCCALSALSIRQKKRECEGACAYAQQNSSGERTVQEANRDPAAITLCSSSELLELPVVLSTSNVVQVRVALHELNAQLNLYTCVYGRAIV
jgi:hypothetical protein